MCLSLLSPSLSYPRSGQKQVREGQPAAPSLLLPQAERRQEAGGQPEASGLGHRKRLPWLRPRGGTPQARSAHGAALTRSRNWRTASRRCSAGSCRCSSHSSSSLHVCSNTPVSRRICASRRPARQQDPALWAWPGGGPHGTRTPGSPKARDSPTVSLTPCCALCPHGGDRREHVCSAGRTVPLLLAFPQLRPTHRKRPALGGPDSPPDPHSPRHTCATRPSQLRTPSLPDARASRALGTPAGEVHPPVHEDGLR